MAPLKTSKNSSIGSIYKSVCEFVRKALHTPKSKKTSVDAKKHSGF